MGDALRRLEGIDRLAHLALWAAASAAGYTIAVHDEPPIALATSAELPGPPFNQAFGLRARPDRLPDVVGRFAARGAPGWLGFDGPPWPGARPDYRLVAHIATPTEVVAPDAVAGVDVERVTGVGIDGWADGPMGRRSDPATAAAWPRILRLLGRRADHAAFVAVEAGRVVGTALLIVRDGVGLLTAATVAPEARGRGLQRALIGARARRARELGCDLLVVQAAADNAPSLRNIALAGFRELVRRDVYRFDPPGSGRAASVGADG